MPRPTHFEIQAQNPARAIAFYESLFGWSFEPFGPPGEYWLIKTGASGPGIDGGLMPRRGPAPVGGEAVTAAVLTCAVEDVDACLDAARRAGGTEAAPKTAIPDLGWVAHVKDTEGNIVGLWQPHARDASKKD